MQRTTAFKTPWRLPTHTGRGRASHIASGMPVQSRADRRRVGLHEPAPWSVRRQCRGQSDPSAAADTPIRRFPLKRSGGAFMAHVTRLLVLFLVAVGGVEPLTAQWLHHPTHGIPRTAEGKADLAGPAPRTAAGRPDLSGMWGWQPGRYFGALWAELGPDQPPATGQELTGREHLKVRRGATAARLAPRWRAARRRRRTECVGRIRAETRDSSQAEWHRPREGHGA